MTSKEKFMKSFKADIQVQIVKEVLNEEFFGQLKVVNSMPLEE